MLGFKAHVVATVVAQQIKLPVDTGWACVLAILLLTQLPTNDVGKAEEVDLSAWAPAPMRKTNMKLLAPGYSLAQPWLGCSHLGNEPVVGGTLSFSVTVKINKWILKTVCICWQSPAGQKTIISLCPYLHDTHVFSDGGILCHTTPNKDNIFVDPAFKERLDQCKQLYKLTEKSEGSSGFSGICPKRKGDARTHTNMEILPRMQGTERASHSSGLGVQVRQQTLRSPRVRRRALQSRNHQWQAGEDHLFIQHKFQSFIG